MIADKDKTRSDFLEKVGRRLRYYRQKKNIAQRTAGEYIGVGQTVVSGYERGYVDMPLSNLPLISDLYDVPVPVLFIDLDQEDVSTVFKGLLKRADRHDDPVALSYVQEGRYDASLILQASSFISMLEKIMDNPDRARYLSYEIANIIIDEALQNRNDQ